MDWFLVRASRGKAFNKTSRLRTVSESNHEDVMESPPKSLQLEKEAIERALPRVSKGLEVYSWLQAALPVTDVARDRAFQTKFNHFYRVRRDATWRAAFYELLQEQKVRRRPFAEVLKALYLATGRVEASFASKLAASVDPSLPVIDAFVLKNLKLRLPRNGAVDSRLTQIVDLHDRLRRISAAFLATDAGRSLVQRFDETYPGSELSPLKKLDLVLWQTRSPQ